jgi:CDP-diacylglycerol--serine O-phosphatidyltransferase
MSTPGRPTHLSMIRGFHFADFLTLGNAACGVLAVFAVMAYAETGNPRRLLAATALIPLALVLDVLDGRVARARRRHSAMGRELDSLADVISFGVAPAVIGYGSGMKGLWDAVVLARAASSPDRALGAVRLADDQQDTPHPEAVAPR